MIWKKLMNAASLGAFALARKNPKKGEAYSLKNIAKQTKDIFQKVEEKKKTKPIQKVEEKKKKKTTNDIKIDKKGSSKPNKPKSNKTSQSGPGDVNL